MNDDEFIYYIKNNNLFIKYKFNPVDTQNVGNIIDISLNDGYLFVFKNTGLWVAKTTNAIFKNATFEGANIQQYKVINAKNNEILIIIMQNEICNLYKSDQNDLKFKLKLKNIVCSKNSDNTLTVEFYAIPSNLPQTIYISNTGSLNSTKSLVSFNFGETWEQIESLNISNIHSKSEFHPLIVSIKSSIIVSNDFGFTWDKILNVSYAISFDNSLLIAGRIDQPSTEILHSFDHGKTFNTFNFTDDENIEILNIANGIEQHSFVVFTKNINNNTINFTKIDFNLLDYKKCTSIDYENYWPFKDDECVFDKKFSYMRRKKDSACLSSELDYKPSVIDCHNDEKLLIYSTANSIIEYDTDRVKKREDPLVQFKNSTNLAIAFDYDYKMRCLFWYDYTTSEIKKICKNNQLETILFREIENVSDLRIDWINKKIYWITNNKIECSDYNGESRRFLKSINKSDLLAIDSSKSLIYWNELDEEKKSWFILKSKISEEGLMEEESLVETKIKINSLIIFNNMPHFMIDNTISCVDLNTKMIKTIYRPKNNISGFTINQGRIYYKETDELSHIKYAPKHKLESSITIPRTRDNITKIFIYESNLYVYDKYNCLNPTNYNCLFMCLNSPDLFSCSNNSSFYIENKATEIAKNNEIVCTFDQDKCLNDKCVSLKKFCDKVDDCLDYNISISGKSYDEANCTYEEINKVVTSTIISLLTDYDNTFSKDTLNVTGVNDLSNDKFSFSFKNIILTSSFGGIIALVMIITIVYYIITRKRRFKSSFNYQNLVSLPLGQKETYRLTDSVSTLLQNQEPFV